MKHFSISEFLRSAKAERLKIDNTPSAASLAALEALTLAVLDPLREAFGSPIRVNSGYRSPALNRAIGGARESQHTRGEAADITAGSRAANRRLFNLAIALRLPFDQLIEEHAYKWLHISHRSTANRRQILHL